MTPPNSDGTPQSSATLPESGEAHQDPALSNAGSRRSGPGIADRAPGAALDGSPPQLARALRLALIVPSACAVLLALLPPEFTLDRFLYEDFYYYLTVAENAVTGRGVTLDGVARTNGFHPLWMLICMVAQAVFGRAVAPNLVLLVAAALHFVQSQLVFTITRRFTNATVAAALALFYCANYRVMACNLSGLETPLQVALFLLVVDRLAEHKKQLPTRVHALGLGALLGLAVAARFDLLLFAAATLTFVILVWRGAVAARIERVSLMIAAMAAVLLPWFVWSRWHSGAWLPNSRVALEVWGAHGFDLSAPPAAMAKQLEHKLFAGAWWLSDTANLLGLWPEVLPNLPLIGGICMSAICGWLALWCWRRQRRERTGEWFLTWLFGYALVHVAYYVIFARAEVRYLLVASATLLVLFAVSLSDLAARSSKTRRAALAIAVLCAAASAYASVDSWNKRQGATRTHHLHRDLFGAATWINRSLPENARIGAFNAGILSYYSGRRVTNLDGVINDEAIDPLRRRRLADYLDRRNIDYVVDFESEIVRFMDEYASEPDWRERSTVVHRTGRIVVLRRERPRD